MKIVTCKWHTEEIERRDSSESTEDEQRKRYQSARKKLDDSISTALLLLPDVDVQHLTTLIINLDNSPKPNTYEEYLDNQCCTLNQALKTLINQGRKTLNVK
jgi:hypothetical protein